MTELSDELKRTHCPKCLGLLTEGGGSNGIGTGMEYRYCEACDTFIELTLTGEWKGREEWAKAHVRQVIMRANAVDRSLEKYRRSKSKNSLESENEKE